MRILLFLSAFVSPFLSGVPTLALLTHFSKHSLASGPHPLKIRLNRGVQASFGYCAAKDQKYFGFKGHLVMHISGLILSYEMAAANIDERDVLPELTHNYKGLMIADKDLLRPSLKEELRDHGLDLQTPLRDNMVDTRPKEWVQQIISLRRTIETVISQLADRFQIQPIKAKDLWHLSAKAGRKILAHTCCFFTVNSLQFDAITS